MQAVCIFSDTSIGFNDELKYLCSDTSLVIQVDVFMTVLLTIMTVLLTIMTVLLTIYRMVT